MATIMMSTIIIITIITVITLKKSHSGSETQRPSSDPQEISRAVAWEWHMNVVSNRPVTFTLTLNVPSPEKQLLSDWFAEGNLRAEAFDQYCAALYSGCWVNQLMSNNSTNNELTLGLNGVKWQKWEIRGSPRGSKKGQHARLLSCQCKLTTETLFLEKALRQKQIFFFGRCQIVD